MHQEVRELFDEKREDYENGEYIPPLVPEIEANGSYYTSSDFEEILYQGNYLLEYFDYMTNKDGFREIVANRVAHSPY